MKGPVGVGLPRTVGGPWSSSIQVNRRSVVGVLARLIRQQSFPTTELLPLDPSHPLARLQDLSLLEGTDIGIIQAAVGMIGSGPNLGEGTGMKLAEEEGAKVG